MPKKLVVTCLINFLIAALMGLALRFSFLETIGVNYRFLTHAHSHVAMLGWVYLMLFVCIIHYFIPDKTPVYTRLFWVTQLAVVGMMLSFPIQGYAAISITFSTLHIFCSYYFVFLVWKNHSISNPVVSYLLKTALVFMVGSTIGVWCLGPAVGLLGQASAFYQIAIQFFLHFQFNGWFLIAVIALFFHLLKIEYSAVFKAFFWVLIAATLLTFALPVQWFAPHKSLLWINSIGIILQLVLLVLFLKLIVPKLKMFLTQKPIMLTVLLGFTLFCFLLKVLFQSVSILPEFSQVAFTHHNFIIGFIHLLMLGIITGFLFSFLLNNKSTNNSIYLSIGVYSFILGFVLTEFLLFLQGLNYYFGSGMLSNYYELLFIFSTLLPIGISFILFNFFKHKQYAT